ncbi:Kinase [Hexamita inflata]|uniref:Kinase n=1 Tax=Hexamita inflata TaxID=28002 RepID=A0AA86PUK9_9EUKA|nr:Kinase [Hexamita inflata]
MNANFEKSSQKIAATSASELFYGTNKQTKESVALKIYNVTSSDPRNTLRELSVMQRLSHQNLIKFYNYYESYDQTVIVTELAQHELLEYIIEKRYYCEDDCRGFIHQVMQGLKYLHDLNIQHGNLKPENILVKNGVVMLSDYNLHNIIPMSHTLIAPGFASPQQLLQQTDFNADSYTLGSLTHLLLTGKLPFKQSDDLLKETLRAQLAKDYEVKSTGISKNGQDFIIQCLKSQPSIDELLKHPWVNDTVPVIPLTGTQMQLKRYLAQIRLRNGSSVGRETLKEVVETTNGFTDPSDE